ncbi:MAG TPA: ATP-binding protein [Thermoguttaceae bacterium]
MEPNFLFPEMQISHELVQDLRRMNPWWEGKPLPVLPRTKRHLVGMIHKRLELRLAPIIVVRGPRQIGKTTAQLHVLQDLLERHVSPQHLFRVQFDELPEIITHSEPLLRLVDWFEKVILNQTLNEAAHKGNPAYLFFDEVQNLKNWAPQLKSLVDNNTVQLLVTGSSALRIGLGQDSLAGRMSTIEAGVLSLTEIGLFHDIPLGLPFLADNGLEELTHQEYWRDLHSHGQNLSALRDEAFQWFSRRGGYPLVHQRADVSWEHLADQLNETIIRRVIEHDLRVGERGRKRDAPLLEEVFRLACRYIGQSPGLNLFAREAKRTLSANVGPQRINHYLRFLGDTLLLRLIEPLEIRLKKKKGNVKICLADHGLRASWLQEIVPFAPDDLAAEPHLTTLAGHIVESVVGATLSTISSLDIAHLPAHGENEEIDFILTIGTKRIPLEVKYQKQIDPLRDTESLRTFIEKSINNAPFGLLVVQSDDVVLPDPRIVAIPLCSLMLLR